MKSTEAAALLTIAAAYDNRKPDPDAAKAWALALDDLRFEDCRDGVVAHYRESRDWIMPVDVRTRVKQLRWNRIVAFNNVCRLEPPAHLADNPAGEIEWFRRVRDRVANGEITHPSQVDERGELKPRDMGTLGQAGQEIPDE